MRIIGLLVELVYRSLFLHSEERFRTASPVLKAVLAVFMIIYYLISPSTGSIILIAIVFLLGLIGFSVYWSFSSLFLSSIPGIWYGLTAYISSCIGLTGQISIIEAIMISIRATSFSYILLFLANIISPTQIANILVKIGARRKATTPILLWRITPYGLRTMYDSLAIGELKNEKSYSRLAPAIASLIEYGKMVEEANYYRLSSPLKTEIPVFRDRTHEYILLSATLIVVLLIIQAVIMS